MKVKDLIEKLKEQDPELPVCEFDISNDFPPESQFFLIADVRLQEERIFYNHSEERVLGDFISIHS